MSKQEEKVLSWGDITLAQHDSMMEVHKQFGDDELEKTIALVIALYGGTEEEYGAMYADEWHKLASARLAFLSEPPKPRFRTGEYRIADRVYKLTPSVKSMTAAQYIDFTNVLRDDPKNTASLLSCVLVPKGKKYNEDYDIAQLEETIREHFIFIDALGISDFFSRVLRISTAVTLDCSKKKLRRELRKEKDKVRRAVIQESINRINNEIHGLGKG